MNFIKVILLKYQLSKIDLTDAARHMQIQFSSRQMVIPKRLADLFEAFIIHPCEETAIELLKFDPKFMGMFKAFKK